MSSSEATLTLVAKARDLASATFGKLGDNVDKMASGAVESAKRIGGAFASTAGSLAIGLGSAVDSLATGGNLGDALLTLGGFMAGELTENFAGSLIEKLAGSGIIATITAPLAAVGSAAGGVLAAAVPIGMALLPALIVGAIIAVIAILIANPEIRNKVIAFVGDVVTTLVNALGTLLQVLPKVIGDAFAAAWSFVIDSVLPFVLSIVELILTLPIRIASLGLDIVRTIIDGMAGLPGRVADTILSAFRNLHIDIGPFHIDASGVRVDLPQLDVPHFAAGGRMVAPGLAVVGEKRSELVHLPRGARVSPDTSGLPRAAGAGAFTIVGVSERELVDVVERGLYVRLQRAGTGG